MDIEENKIKLFQMISQIYPKVGGLLISYKATIEKLKDLEAHEWYDPELNRSENKHRMKELDSAARGYRTFIIEMSVIAMAKIIEDTIIDIKDVFGVNFNIWSNTTYTYHVDAKIIRSLNNVIKHNQSRISASNVPSGKYLVDTCGFSEGDTIASIFSGRAAKQLDVERELFQIYIFLMDLVHDLSNFQKDAVDLKSNFTFEKFSESFIPEFINFKSSSEPPELIEIKIE